jgi:bifunctional NMN adenylyltransferase/nudix hydrolase
MLLVQSSLEIPSHQQLGASMQKQVTVFIGRFSPFHLGHEEVLLRALHSSEVVLLLIGSARCARDTKNPFTEQERAEVILTWYADERRIANMYNKPKMGSLIIEPLVDSPYNDSEWIAQVQETVLRVRTENNVPPDWPNIITGAQRDASTWYLKSFGGFFKTDFIKETAIGFDFSATELRDDYFKGGNLWEYKTPEATILFLDKWRKTQWFTDMVAEYKFIQEYKVKLPEYPINVLTADALVIQSGHVLLVGRGQYPGKGLMALPGGHLDQNETLKQTSMRELKEETDIEMSPAQLLGSIVDEKLFDYPDRSHKARVVTMCYTYKLRDDLGLPKIKPQRKEVLWVRWVPLAEAKADRALWFEDHYHIFTTMLARASQ